MIDHLRFNAANYYPLNTADDFVAANGEQYIKNYVGKRVAVSSFAHGYITENDMQYIVPSLKIKEGDIVTYQITDQNNQIWLSVDNYQTLNSHPRVFFKLREFLENGGSF